MPQNSQPATVGRAYVSAVIAVGIAIVGACVYDLASRAVPAEWYLLAALTLLSGSATVKLSSSHASISVSEVFVFIAILLYGSSAGTIIVALDGLVISFWLTKRHRELSRVFFNMSAPAISAWCSAQLFFLSSGLEPLAAALGPSSLSTILAPLALSALTYFLLNTWLIAFAIALERRVNPLHLWFSNFVWLSLTYFGGASVAGLAVAYNRTVDFAFIGVIVPLLLVLYFTFRTTIGRLEDANRHVEQLNRLYLSTIETLAMAIDAKDQITHGHIRRVQAYAVGLANRVGVNDENSIKAIEAAALLHDMGKLAVPEYILNKPGKLTPAEFEKMKLHASVGADILSSIDFPYPVVPIVRHHHENWDGSGYPTGLKGTDIPIGARILAVVDCFDALTSDRPYRPKLSDEDALRILKQRRGTMYDPLIVDTFERVHRELAPCASAWVDTPSSGDVTAARNDQIINGLDDITASADEMSTLHELARALAGQASIQDSVDIIARHLRRLIPSSQTVFYLYDADKDELEAKHAFGSMSSLLIGVRIQLGERLSGWVAANRQTIVNSDPTLDLGDIARSMFPRLRSCLSTTLIAEDQLVGVLTLYSDVSEAFDDDHRRVLESVAQHVGHTLRRAAEFDGGTPATHASLPNFRDLERWLNSTGSDPSLEGRALSLICVDVMHSSSDRNVQSGRLCEDVVLDLVRIISASVRPGDLLFRYDSHQLVALLDNADRGEARRIVGQIESKIRDQRIASSNVSSRCVRIDVRCVSAPADGSSLRQLLLAARTSMGVPSEPAKVH
jgi:putative nucleotidyltransferase with HDIG domain